MITSASCSENNARHVSGHFDPHLERMRRDATTYAARKDFGKSDSIGIILYNEADKSGNEVYMAYGLLCQSFYNYTSENADKRLAKVKSAEKLALETGNDTLLTRIYNTLGIYATAYTHNYNDAKQYYNNAIKYARNAKSPLMEINAECNLSELYRSIGDTLGIKYDIDIYKYAESNGNEDLLHSAAHHCAEYYINRPGQEEKAFPYIKRLNDIGMTYLAHLLTGKYHMAKGNSTKAEDEFNKAIDVASDNPNVYLSYARLLNERGDYRKSDKMLRRAEECYKDKDIYNSDQIETYRLRSDNSAHIGNHADAFRYLQKYTSTRDSIDRERNAEAIQRYKVKFEVEKKELELKREKERTRLRNAIIILIAILFVLTVGGMLLYFRRRDRLHRIIATQQMDFVVRGKNEKIGSATELQGQDIITDSENNPGSDAESAADDNGIPQQPRNGLSATKADSIWDKIVFEMETNRIFTDSRITRDIFAERIGCNHTWLTQTIKEKTGKSYTRFINHRRIEESVKILSDITSEPVLKEIATRVGFLSASPFYAAFKQQIGMSPAEFRRHIIALSNQERDTDNVSI